MATRMIKCQKCGNLLPHGTAAARQRAGVGGLCDGCLSGVEVACLKCGQPFVVFPTGGRWRKTCDGCRKAAWTTCVNCGADKLPLNARMAGMAAAFPILKTLCGACRHRWLASYEKHGVLGRDGIDRNACFEKHSDLLNRMARYQRRAMRDEPLFVEPPAEEFVVLDLKPGDVVMLDVPYNPRLHGATATVAVMETWGARVQTAAAATGKFRALWSEMRKLEDGSEESVEEKVVKKQLEHSSSGGTIGKPSFAKVVGYTGDVCLHCGGFKMQRSGTCLLCMDCGQTTGCV